MANPPPPKQEKNRKKVQGRTSFQDKLQNWKQNYHSMWVSLEMPQHTTFNPEESFTTFQSQVLLDISGQAKLQGVMPWE